METIPISSIRIDGARQRSDAGDLLDLAESLREYGLLEPIILDQDNRLIAGFRRLSAAVFLGWKEIPFVRRENVDAIMRRRLELEENVRRLDLSWEDQAKAVREIHEMQKASDPTWTVDKTAAIAGLKQRMGHYYIEIAEAVDKHPEIKQANTITGAMQRLDFIKRIERKRSEVAARQFYGEQRFEVLTGDALEVLPTMESESVDAIITNPPFGISLEFKRLRPYPDEPDANVAMIRAVIPEFYRLLKPGSWLVMFYDILKLEWLRSEMVRANFDVNTMPCCWTKPNKTQSGGGFNPNYEFVTAYEMFLVARKGEAVLSRRGRNNVFMYDTPASSERVHSVQMPIDLCEELVSLFSLGGQTVLDPFCGSGSIGVGALNQKRHFIGIEINPEYADRARTRLQEASQG